MRTLTLAAALCLVAPLAAQNQQALLELARQGKADEAWRQWRELPPSLERSRAGVALAAATGDVTQGLAVYEELQRQHGGPDNAALGLLAAASARGLTDSTDHDTQVAACAVVLQFDDSHQRCWDVARGVRSDIGNPARQASDAYRMADAGFRPWPDLLEQVLTQLPVENRVALAREFTQIPAADRVTLAAPGLDSNDAVVRRQAASVLGDIQGPEAMSALRRAFDATQDFGARVNLAVPLARHGDLEAVQVLQQVGGTLIGPAAVDADIALAAVGDRTAMPPAALLNSARGAEKGRLAVALWPQAREAAEKVVIEMLRDPAPSTRAAGFRAAGAIGLGDDQVVYGQLSQADPAIRIAAVLAVRDTITDTVGGAGSR